MTNYEAIDTLLDFLQKSVSTSTMPENLYRALHKAINSLEVKTDLYSYLGINQSVDVSSNDIINAVCDKFTPYEKSCSTKLNGGWCKK